MVARNLLGRDECVGVMVRVSLIILVHDTKLNLVNNDDFISRLRLLKYGREAVLNNLGNIPTSHDPENPNSIV